MSCRSGFEEKQHVMTQLLDLPDVDRTDDFDLLTLPDGRDLAFMEWGDPDGFPTFYFHGTPSSRLEGALADGAAREHGFRLIAIDRPGFGRSSFQPGRQFSDWPKDILALADHLRLDSFGVVGHSGGGPHLFACGAHIDPKRLKFIGALGPWAPVASPEIEAGLNSLDRFYANMARRMPWIMRAGFAPIGWGAKYWPNLFFKIMQSSVAKADQSAMENEVFLGHFRRMEREGFRQGGRGAAHEALIAYQPWDFDVADVKVPTFIWLGAADIFVSNAMGKYLEQTIPGVEFHLIPGKGHFNVENWHDILASCRGVLPE